MSRTSRSAAVTAFAFALLIALSSAAAAQPYYVRGNFYCHPGVNDPAPDDCWGWDAGNQMFDDGLHGDGAADDGIWGATIACTAPAGRLEFKIATSDWSFAVPNSPIDALANAVLFASGPGDLIHFTLDQRFLFFGGWQPFADSPATDHYLPPGATLELIGGAPELGNWNSGIPLQHIGEKWQRFVTITSPGTYEFKFRVTGTWDVANFGYDYNNTQGRNAFVTTTEPNTDVFFQFDNTLGRVRAIELGATSTRPKTWGRLKAMYR